MKNDVDRCPTPYYYAGMPPNKRAENIKRITITIDEELLERIEAASEKAGINRLEYIRKALEIELAKIKLNDKEK